MEDVYFKRGYELMMTYLRENRILTKERKFRRKLDKFYDKHKDKDTLNVDEELEYLKLEQYFYNNIRPPTNSEEQALLNFLNIVASVDYIEE